MQSTSSMSEVSAVIDLQRLRFNLSSDRELLAELFDIFIAELPALQEGLQGAVERGDGLELGRVAHRLKGSLLALAAKCSEIAEAIEVEARRGCTPAVSRMVNGLLEELGRVVTALRTIVLEDAL